MQSSIVHSRTGHHGPTEKLLVEQPEAMSFRPRTVRKEMHPYYL
jgi:hypothetical protein